MRLRSLKKMFLTVIGVILMITLIPPQEAFSMCRADHKNEKENTSTVRIGWEGEPTVFNPILTSSTVSSVVNDLVFSKLVFFDENGEMSPDLARSWNISEDGLEYTFYLRENALFHDGTECTAEDVVFTYESLVDPKNKSPFRQTYENVLGWEAVNKHTVKAYLKEPCAIFIRRLIVGILPKHILMGEDLTSTAFNFHPIGSGPFKFAEWDKKSENILLEANEDYYLGKPKIDNVLIKTFPAKDYVWSAFLRGEVDFAFYLDWNNYRYVKDDPTFRTFEMLSSRYYAVIYNLDLPMFKDKKTRRALTMAIDRVELINKLEGGHGRVAAGPFYPESWAMNEDVEALPYDPGKALSLLKEAGWEDTDGDGILDRNGEKFEFELLVKRTKEKQVKIAKFVRQYLGEIGVRVKIIQHKEKDITNFRNNFDTILTGFQSAMDPHVANTYFPGVKEISHNLGKYENSEVARLFIQAARVSDRNIRTEIYRKLHNIIYDEQPVSFLYFPNVYHAVSKGIENTDKFLSLPLPFIYLTFVGKNSGERR